MAGVAALAALALAGCQPPHQNPSDKKVDTAQSQDAGSLKGAGASATDATNVVEADQQATTTVAAEEVPSLNNCAAQGLVRPTRLTVDCENQDDFLEDIVWDTWDANLAEGTATRVVLSPDNREEGVKVVLGNPQVVDKELVFTSVSVDGTNVTPENNY